MSLRHAINKKCQECIYDPISGDGTWRQQVAACSAKSCPLWPVRPKPSIAPANHSIALRDSGIAHFGGIAEVDHCGQKETAR